MEKRNLLGNASFPPDAPLQPWPEEPGEALRRLGKQCVTRRPSGEGGRQDCGGNDSGGQRGRRKSPSSLLSGRGGGGRGKKTCEASKDSKSTRESGEGGTWGEGGGE